MRELIRLRRRLLLSRRCDMGIGETISYESGLPAMKRLRLFHFDIKTLGNYGDTLLFECVRQHVTPSFVPYTPFERGLAEREFLTGVDLHLVQAEKAKLNKVTLNEKTLVKAIAKRILARGKNLLPKSGG